MAETTFTVDLTELRNLADKADRAAEATATPRLPGCDDDLPGSTTACAASSAPIAARLDELRSTMTAWAAVVRSSATAFDDAERSNAGRIAGS